MTAFSVPCAHVWFTRFDRAGGVQVVPGVAFHGAEMEDVVSEILLDTAQWCILTQLSRALLVELCTLQFSVSVRQGAGPGEMAGLSASEAVFGTLGR